MRRTVLASLPVFVALLVCAAAVVSCGRNDASFDRVIGDGEDGFANCQGDSVTRY